MSFADPALPAEHMVRQGQSLARKVYRVPVEIGRTMASRAHGT